MQFCRRLDGAVKSAYLGQVVRILYMVIKRRACSAIDIAMFVQIMKAASTSLVYYVAAQESQTRFPL